MTYKMTIFGIYLNDEKEIPADIGKTSNLKDQMRFHRVRIKFMDALYDLKLSHISVEFKILEIVNRSIVDERKAYWIAYYNEQGTLLSNRRPVSGGQQMNRGAAHGNAKLNSWNVRAILGSEETAAQLAQRYGVSKSTIHRIIQRVTWRGIKA